MKNFLNYSGLSVQAHRGGSLESYENTLESFAYSDSIGCKYIETDVQVSSDGIPYIFHDDTLKRLLNMDAVFNDHTFIILVHLSILIFHRLRHAIFFLT